jgi:hypothetical protein
MSNAMLVTRRGLVPLRRFVQLPVLPDDVRGHLVSEVDRWARETQTALETHAATVRHDQGRLLKTIRDHALTVVVSEAVVSPPAEAESASTNPPVRGRRMIL